jgi:hypothetical protein
MAEMNALPKQGYSGAHRSSKLQGQSPRVIMTSELDFEGISFVANGAYEGRRDFLTADRFAWAYQQAFSNETLVVQLIADHQIVGHGAIIKQTFCAPGKSLRLAQLADLFLLPEYRNFPNVCAMYRIARTFFEENHYDIVVAMPNARAMRLNQHFLDFSPIQQLQLRGGISYPLLRKRENCSSYSAAETCPARLANILAPFLSEKPVGEIIWSPAQLAQRLQPPNYKRNSGSLTVHVGPTTVLITSRNIHHGLVYTLIWSVLSICDEIDPKEVTHLLRLASRYHRCQLFVYAGWNKRLVKPNGRKLPNRFRPSPLTLQGRTYGNASLLEIKRYELIDFDFA